MRLVDFFDRGVSIDKARICTLDHETGRSRTFAEVQQASHQIANGLLAAGVIPDKTKVAVWSPNCGRALEAVLGVARAGAIWVAVNARNSIQDIAHHLDNTDVEILLYHGDLAAQLETLTSGCPKLRLCVRIDVGSTDAVSVDAWTSAAFQAAPEIREDANAAVVIFGSGGTTGRPKGVVFSNRTWECMTISVNVAMPPKSDHPVHLVISPMTHAAGGLGMALLAVGATQIFMKGFRAADVLAAIETYKVTHLFLPPTAIYGLLSDTAVRQHDYSSLEYFFYAAAPMSVDKVRDALSVFGPVMVQGYGQMEAGPLIGAFFSASEHWDALHHNPQRLASCGRPNILTKLRIVDESGQPVPSGERGEIVIGGDFRMREYYNNEAATRETVRDGWVYTGDIGQIDEDGFLYIVDRKREMIITGGFNVYPGEVEQVISAHKAVQDCAVIGVPDEKWGEAVKAVVQLKPGTQADSAEIIAFCKERAGSVMAPKSVEFWAELPRSAVGKVLRRVVREQFWKGRERSIV
ncbi:acyl-CoA synthetase (AMP-forming)/AMP-acid ligase II [Rhodopseudomonas rhenobacensis]|uniref:3-methylmercaptopropionyl-CoA ligase n=1 Tax=Rhodopseudomonas rhenobacensis TaxID=87461 RepID=A0A7W7Z5U5_9BRAD|nr:AMP-binding protein [Rhodopseudomonas rhenobacensis]MBB5048072.1 acyl-CoA synthetase (AMP-forming)/AMP-acid ligase II [Rhodopseudomonas rhenobacensis]